MKQLGVNQLKSRDRAMVFLLIVLVARRFAGINDKYQPVEVRQGSEIIVEKSMAINTLRLLDRKLFDHIQARLEHAYFLFGGRKV